MLSAPLSFWGGVDHNTGDIVDPHHPNRGSNMRGKVLVMPAGKGSSSSSSVFAELLRTGKGPAAVVLTEPDPLPVLGSIVADMLYQRGCPFLVVEDPEAAGLRSGVRVAVDGDRVIPL